jgi:hypothetical protein
MGPSGLDDLMEAYTYGWQRHRSCIKVKHIAANKACAAWYSSQPYGRADAWWVNQGQCVFQGSSSARSESGHWRCERLRVSYKHGVKARASQSHPGLLLCWQVGSKGSRSGRKLPECMACWLLPSR